MAEVRTDAQELMIAWKRGDAAAFVAKLEALDDRSLVRALADKSGDLGDGALAAIRSHLDVRLIERSVSTMEGLSARASLLSAVGIGVMIVGVLLALVQIV